MLILNKKYVYLITFQIKILIAVAPCYKDAFGNCIGNCGAGCAECNSATTCMKCNSVFGPSLPGSCSSCSISNCADCSLNYTTCVGCELGYRKTVEGLCANMIRDAKVIGTKTIRVKKTATFTGKRYFVVNCQNTATSLHTTTIAKAASQHPHATTLNALTELCPTNFTYINSSRTCFKYIDKEVTYLEAVHLCNGTNTHLPILLNEETASSLLNYTIIINRYWIWLAIERVNASSPLMWRSYNDNKLIPLNYTNWKNDTSDEGRPYAYMLTYINSFAGRWILTAKADTNYVVCQYDPHH